MTPEEILAKAKAARKQLPRWVWVAALAIGAACAIAFAWLLVAPAGTPTMPDHHEVGGPGFASGILIGLAVGFLVGWAARHARHAPSASSRSNP